MEAADAPAGRGLARPRRRPDRPGQGCGLGRTTGGRRRADPRYIGKAGKIDTVNLAGSRLTHANTDARGTATFDWFPRRFEQVIPFVVDSKIYHCEEQPAFDPAKGRSEVVVPVVRTMHVDGRVTFPDGRPAPGILIQAEGFGDGPMYALQSARTGEDGTYAFNLPAEKHYILGVVDDDWAAPSQTCVIVKEDRPVRGLDFRLGKGTLIRGLVTTEPDDKPVPGRHVMIEEVGEPIPPLEAGVSPHQGRESLIRRATTDKDGRYALRVGPGEYAVLGPIPNGPPETITIQGEDTIERDFEIPRHEEGTLTGVVVVKGS